MSHCSLLTARFFLPDGAVLWKRLMGTRALAAAASTHGVSVRAYAHCHRTLGVTNGTVSLALINVHPTDTVDVILGGAGVGRSEAALSLNASARVRFMLTADSPSRRPFECALVPSTTAPLPPRG